jgi:parallel beta-helix repeat protein
LLTVKLASRLIALAIALALPPGLAHCAPAVLAAGGATFTVCASGCDFTTIQAALDDQRTAAGDTILVTDAVHTEAGITVRKGVTIQGQGAGKTTVQAHATMEAAPDRVFLIAAGATVSIRDLTIRHGNARLDRVRWRCGGGIANEGTLTVESCVINDNTGNNGGGIWSYNGSLTVINCSIHHNTADRIAPDGYEDGFGGGIELEGKDALTVINSTIHDNEAKSQGGGIYVAYGGTATLTNCTVSGNESTTYGGGLYVMGVAHLTHCTVVNNLGRAERAAGQIAERVRKDHLRAGGGVYVMGTLHMTNSIVANNGKGDCNLSQPDAYGTRGRLGTNQSNLVGDGDCDAAYSGDPLLGPLADNGGTTQTHALLSGSPAIDAIPATGSTLDTDQRGLPRPVACASPETPADLGAFEVQADECPAAAPSPTPSIKAEARGSLWLAAPALVGLLLLGAMAWGITWRWRRGR